MGGVSGRARVPQAKGNSSQSAERQQQGEGKVRLVLGMPRVSDQRRRDGLLFAMSTLAAG